MKRACIFNTFHDVKKTCEEWPVTITRILKSGLTRNLLVFLANQSTSFLIMDSRTRIDWDTEGRKRPYHDHSTDIFKILPSSYERAVFSLCSAHAPIGVAASDIAPLRPNCFCYLAVCAATRPKPSRVFPASIKSTRRVM